MPINYTKMKKNKKNYFYAETEIVRLVLQCASAILTSAVLMAPYLAVIKRPHSGHFHLCLNRRTCQLGLLAIFLYLLIKKTLKA
jgi:hypothetical protein